jgi:glycosyltransferase 2 family protein
MTWLRKRYRLIATAKIAVAIGLMWFLIHGGKLNTAAVAGAAQRWPLLLLGIFLLYLQMAVGAWRWNILLNVQAVRIPLVKTFSLTMIGTVFNMIIPGAVGGDVIKGYYVSRCTVERKAHVVTTILVDRVLGLVGMMAVATFAGLLDWSLVSVNRTFTTLFFFAAASFLLLCVGLWISFCASGRWATAVEGFTERLPGSAIIKRLIESLLEYRSRPSAVFQAVALSCVAQALCCVTFYLSALALGYSDLPVRAYLLVVPLGLVTTALPVAPGGIGVGQAAFYGLFQLLPEATGAMGANACTVFQCLIVLMSLTGFLFYFTYKDEAAPDVFSVPPPVADVPLEG